MVLDALQFGFGIPVCSHIRTQGIIWWFQFVTGLVWKSPRLFWTFLLEFFSLTGSQGAVWALDFEVKTLDVLWRGLMPEESRSSRSSVFPSSAVGISPGYPTQDNNWQDSCVWGGSAQIESPQGRWEGSSWVTGFSWSVKKSQVCCCGLL